MSVDPSSHIQMGVRKDGYAYSERWYVKIIIKMIRINEVSMILAKMHTTCTHMHEAICTKGYNAMIAIVCSLIDLQHQQARLRPIHECVIAWVCVKV